MDFTPGNLIVCNGPDCTFADLVHLAQVFINDLVILSTLIATVVFIYAGFTLITSGGNPGKKDKAKGMLWKVVVGYIIILSAWLIIYTVVHTLVGDSYSILGQP